MKLIKQGKVRNVYEVNKDTILLEATDRVSALDSVLDVEIEGKGELLTAMSNFWFEFFNDVPNHLIKDKIPELESLFEPSINMNACTAAKKLTPLPIEAIVRGYITGSGWKDYNKTGTICGHTFEENLINNQKLPEPIFTPSTKGKTDVNISYEEMEEIVGKDIANTIKNTSMYLYIHGANYAAKHGIIIADTKFEFGLDEHGKVILMDEVLTPDSSRFWNAKNYRAGIITSFDKQLIRDYLTHHGKDAKIPDSILNATKERYQEALRVLTQTP